MRQVYRRFLLFLGLAALTAKAAHVRAAEADSSAPPASKIETLEVDSKLLKTKKALVVYLPPGFDASGKTKYPVLYYLHGLNNTARRFVDEGMPPITDKLITEGKIAPCIIACPTGDYSFYVNKPDGSAPYEDYVTQEVRPFVESSFPVRTERPGRAIGGISMGGYGALNISLHHPELFGSVSAHTPFVVEKLPEETRTDQRSQQFLRLFHGVFGNPINQEAWKLNDPFQLIQKGGFDGLSIYFNSASKDRYFLNRESNALHKLMETKAIPHVFRSIDDVHGWVSLRNQWEDILAFHSKVFAASLAGR